MTVADASGASRRPIRAAAFLVVGALAALGARPAEARQLRVCADPNNMPFSNAKGEGFENKIVELVARDMGATPTYTWWAQRRGFVRNTLRADSCDLWPGVATGLDMLLATRPYYTSTYVFVTRADLKPPLVSLDDPRLRELRIGVQMVGNDAQNPPPTHALARRGINKNVRGYMLYGDYTHPNPPAAVIDAVAKGDVDVAIAWGPLAGYFAAAEPEPLAVTPVEPQFDGPQWPMRFDISMGVLRGNSPLKQLVDHALVENRDRITAILKSYHVPLIGQGQSAEAE